ncbi:MAG TPA: shikimate kinase I [Spirochaetaceae bacterium]|jgi:shikimate kinase|nr:shikimate kinase I [Spirochaetaceae bacterium]
MQKQYNKLRTIALVGLPGSGKSSVGKALASIMACRFADSDESVCAAAGQSIPELFRHQGEAAFRALETSILDELTQADAGALGPRAPDASYTLERLVLATGGGCVLSPENRRLLRDRCFVVWLDISPQKAALRLAKSAGKAGMTGRPLLDGGDAEERLVALDAERRPLYEELADMRIDAGGSGYRAIARRIICDLAIAIMEDKRAALP